MPIPWLDTVLNADLGEKYCAIFGVSTVLNADLAESTVRFSASLQY